MFSEKSLTMEIHQSILTSELREKIHEGFYQHSIQCTGINGWSPELISFELREAKQTFGYVVVQVFWGQLHIKYLLLEADYRGKGFGTLLMNHAFDFGRSHGCTFAFVETMNFQAPLFYQKLGFNIDFIRTGFAKGTSLYYLSKDL